MIRLATPISLYLIVRTYAADIEASVTIDQAPAYSLQRQCGKGCLQNNYDNGDDVQAELGCTWNGCYCGTQYQAAATSIIRSCWSAYCGTSSITMLSYDISTALSIYGSYCVDVMGGAQASTTAVFNPGGEASPSTSGDGGGVTIYETHLTVVTATTTIGSVTNTGSAASGASTNPPKQSTVTGDVYIVSTTLVTVSSPPSSSPTDAPGTQTNGTPQSNTAPQYSTSDKIALGVGLGLGIPTVVATIWMCCFQMSRRR